MSDEPNMACDGFTWGELRMHPNTGFDISIPITESTSVSVRVQNRHGHATISFDYCCIFEDGHCWSIHDPIVARIAALEDAVKRLRGSRRRDYGGLLKALFALVPEGDTP